MIEALPIPVAEAKGYLAPDKFEIYKAAFDAFYSAPEFDINRPASASELVEKARIVHKAVLHIPADTEAGSDLRVKSFQLTCMVYDMEFEMEREVNPNRDLAKLAGQFEKLKYLNARMNRDEGVDVPFYLPSSREW